MSFWSKKRHMSYRKESQLTMASPPKVVIIPDKGNTLGFNSSSLQRSRPEISILSFVLAFK